MTGHGAKFGRKKEEAIVALLSQQSLDQAARVVGVTPKTLLRWLQVPEFKAAYHKARRDAFGQATSRLQHTSGAAISTILKIMLDKDAPVSSRLRAAESVVVHAAKAIEIEEIEARVSELERAAEAAKQSR